LPTHAREDKRKGLPTSSPIQTILSVLELHQSQLLKKQIVDF